MANFGLIGLGGQGFDHLEASRFTKRAKIISVCDTRNSVLELAREKFPGIRTCLSIDEMLSTKKDLCGLVLALPHHVYAQKWEQVESFGLPILKEKPLGRNMGEALGFLSIASSPGVFVKTAIQRRHHPSYRFLFDRLRNSENLTTIHEIYGVLHLGKLAGGNNNLDSWRANSLLAGGGALLDCGYHLVDLVTSLSGQMELVSARLWVQGKPATNEMIEDQANLYAKAGNSWIFMEIRRDGEIKDGHPQKKEEIRLSTSDGEYKADRTGVWLDGTQLMTCDSSWLEALVDQLDDFADDIENRRVDHFAIWEQAPVMRVIERAYALAREFVPIEVAKNG